MTVSELIEKLQECDLDAVVLLADSEEGDEFLELEMVDSDLVINDDGIVGIPELSDELIDTGFTEDDVVTDGQDCVILYP